MNETMSPLDILSHWKEILEAVKTRDLDQIGDVEELFATMFGHAAEGAAIHHILSGVKAKNWSLSLDAFGDLCKAIAPKLATLEPSDQIRIVGQMNAAFAAAAAASGPRLSGAAGCPTGPTCGTPECCDLVATGEAIQAELETRTRLVGAGEAGAAMALPAGFWGMLLQFGLQLLQMFLDKPKTA